MKSECQDYNHGFHNMENHKHSERNTFGSRSFIFRLDYYKSGPK